MFPRYDTKQHDQEKIERELDNILQEGTVTPVEFFEWATTIVLMMKNNYTEVFTVIAKLQ